MASGTLHWDRSDRSSACPTECDMRYCLLRSATPDVNETGRPKAQAENVARL